MYKHLRVCGIVASICSVFGCVCLTFLGIQARLFSSVGLFAKKRIWNKCWVLLGTSNIRNVMMSIEIRQAI